MTYPVVQWTTGNVGRQSVAAIAVHADYDLVGCYAWSPDKVGRDVGELCGLASIGVEATRRGRVTGSEARLRRLQPHVG